MKVINPATLETYQSSPTSKTTSIFNKKSDAFTSITDYGRDGLLIQIGVAAGNKYKISPSTSNIDAFTHTHNEYDREQDSNTTVIETRVEISSS